MNQKIDLYELLGCYSPLWFFPLTEFAVKNIPRLLSERQKLCYVYRICGKKSPTCTEYAVKNLLGVLSMR
jgi:hypothetical protein